MGTALTDEGYSSNEVESSEIAHVTAGSGRTDTDWSNNDTPGGTSILEAGGDIKITTLALVMNHIPDSDSARDWGVGGAAAHSEGADDTDIVNNHSHTAASPAKYGAPHDTGHEVQAMPKEVDTGFGSALASAKGHETANGDMGVAQHMAQDIGSALADEDGDDTNKVNRDDHLMGSENDHTMEHKAADTDAAESKGKDHDAPHVNGAKSRGRAICVVEQPDAPRSHAPQGAGDETGKAGCTETIHLNAEAHVTEDGGEFKNIPVVIGRAKTEKARNKAHASPKTPPVRSAQTRGLTNTANTCFLNASLHLRKRVLCLHKGARCLRKRALCLHKEALCLRKRALCLHKGALCLRKRALCLHKGALCLRKRAPCLRKRALYHIIYVNQSSDTYE